MLSSTLILALVYGAPFSWGYTNPVEGGSTETVTNMWSLPGDLYVGETTPYNALIVTNGGQVYSEQGYIGFEDTADNNSVLVTGSGSVWSNDNLVVGNYGKSNSLMIADGGQMYSYGELDPYLNEPYYDICIGNHPGSDDNEVIVTGTGSVLETLYSVKVGLEGSGNALTVSDGGQFYSAGWSYLGTDNNEVLVTGSGSIWRNDGTLVVGYGNSNVLTVTDEGQFYGFPFVGWGGSGNSLTIEDGGRLSGGGYCGGFGGSNNTVLVTGSGSIWSGGFRVGHYADSNTLIIEDGGQVNGSGIIGYRGFRQRSGHNGGYDKRMYRNNRVLVSGAGSVWESHFIRVGTGGLSNWLMIEDGGRVYSTNSAHIGTSSPGFFAVSNAVMVSGEGSQWYLAGALEVGDRWPSADNALMVFSNATVSAGSVVVHNTNSVHLGSGGTLVITGGFTNADLHIYISGIAPSDCGHLSVSGEADLIGSLEVMLDGFTPLYGDVFDLFDWNSPVLNGFTAINLPLLPSGLEWNTDALYTTGELSVDANLMPADCIIMPPINLKSRGRMPVTVLSTADFDAASIDPSSVRMAGASPVKHMLKDLDGDGYPDLKLFFNMRELTIDPDDPCVQLVVQDYTGEYMLGLPSAGSFPRR